MRLQVFLSHAGVASRRASEGLISQGLVSVNGIVVTSQGEKVFGDEDIRVDGQRVRLETTLHYLAMYKPPLYISSAEDDRGRLPALSLIPKSIHERVYNIGRLDYRSEGLLLFTNDGDFASIVSHPGSCIEKEYVVSATGFIPDAVIDSFIAGITVEDVDYKAVSAERLGRKSIRVVLVEGKNREIRRVFSHFHLHPDKLRRVRIGPVLLDGLAPGETRPLNAQEISCLRGL
jgi:23S rRNA pseudouridine2605 synthase